MLTCIQLALQYSRAQFATSAARACASQAASKCFRLQQCFGGDSHAYSKAECICIEHCDMSMLPAVCTRKCCA